MPPLWLSASSTFYTGDMGVVIIQFLLRQSSYNFYKNKTPIIFSLPLHVNHRVCTYICYILYNTALFSAFFLRRKGLRHNLRLISFIFNRHRDGVCPVVLAQGFPVPATPPPFSLLAFTARACGKP